MLVLGTPRLREKSGLGSEEGTGTWVRGWTPGFPDPVLGVARGGGAGGPVKRCPHLTGRHAVDAVSPRAASVWETRGRRQHFGQCLRACVPERRAR